MPWSPGFAAQRRTAQRREATLTHGEQWDRSGEAHFVVRAAKQCQRRASPCEARSVCADVLHGERGCGVAVAVVFAPRAAARGQKAAPGHLRRARPPRHGQPTPPIECAGHRAQKRPGARAFHFCRARGVWPVATEHGRAKMPARGGTARLQGPTSGRDVAAPL
jgi:hypothetical protein